MIVPGPAFTTGVFHRSKRLLGTGACALVSRPGAGQRSVQRSECLILRPTENFAIIVRGGKSLGYPIPGKEIPRYSRKMDPNPKQLPGFRDFLG